MRTTSPAFTRSRASSARPPKCFAPGMKDKLMPVRFLMEKLPVQCQGIIDADPFLQPTKKYPADIPVEDQKRLTQQITDAINTDVIPAYKTFAAFLRAAYATADRTTLSVKSLPDGTI